MCIVGNKFEGLQAMFCHYILIENCILVFSGGFVLEVAGKNFRAIYFGNDRILMHYLFSNLTIGVCMYFRIIYSF